MAPKEQGLENLRFWVSKKCLHRSTKTQCTKDDEHVVSDVPEARRNEEAQCKVEQPISDSSNAHASGSRFKRPDLCGIHPGDGSKRERIYNDQKIRKGDDHVRGFTGHSDDDVKVAIDALRSRD